MDLAVTAASGRFGSVQGGRSRRRAENRRKVDGYRLRSKVEESVTEETANMAVEIGTVGFGLQEFLIAPAGNAEVLVDGSAAKFQLENGSVVVISHTGQQAGCDRQRGQVEDQRSGSRGGGR